MWSGIVGQDNVFLQLSETDMKYPLVPARRRKDPDAVQNSVQRIKG